MIISRALDFENRCYITPKYSRARRKAEVGSLSVSRHMQHLTSAHTKDSHGYLSYRRVDPFDSDRTGM